MLKVEEALAIILEHVVPLGSERVSILEARGRVLREEIRAGGDIPPWDNSAMDGFAVRAGDIQSASRPHPVQLRVLEDLPAGRMTATAVGEGQAIRIMTGAPLPPGADVVVPVEDTEPAGEGQIRVFQSWKARKNVRPAGEDVRDGELVLSEGVVLEPPEIGMLASLGYREVAVTRRPEVAILATGNEIVDLGTDPGPGQIRNSNSYSLGSQVMACGGRVRLLGVAADLKAEIRARLEEGFRSDLLLTTGGVSVGDYDYVRGMFQEVGAEVRFWGVAMRPGKPLVFGQRQGKLFWGIPGNPVATMVTFEELVRPALRKMMGYREWFNPTLSAILEERLEKKAGRRYYIRVSLRREGERILASSTGPQGSGILRSMISAHGLAVLPEEAVAMEAGERVEVRLLPWAFLPDLLASRTSSS
ncbi:MAG: molybdopterin molybdotransferase MoeA [Candidatus Tectomicrobia bacterium]|uniref:Molybdopterin molybdenumtransferase n=1 Tax=Tectimicrobiota bacterium TaxID=2528274 RepID=A0A932FVQ0_UNCTE|nr:molybdopterin molybdotransferase MoeA [Candidatus Tectomicrobia bacterium]